MTLSEMLWFLAMVTSGWIIGFAVAIGLDLGRRGLVLGQLLGAIGGVVLPFTLRSLVGLLLDGLERKWFLVSKWGFSPLPVCRRGVCQGGYSEACEGDYKSVGSTPEGQLLECRCGDRYLSAGVQLIEILPDGTQRPYQSRGRYWFSRWKAATSR
jgi:hypothetical protein